jgi:hypothetical protein
VDSIIKDLVIGLGAAILGVAVVVRVVKRGPLILPPASNYVQGFAFGVFAVVGFLFLRGIFVH